MKTLLFNGRWESCLQIGKELEQFLTGNDGIIVKEHCDVLYHLYYTDFTPELIIINQGDFCIDSDANDWDIRLSKAEYFPTELGKICKEICKEKGKREPKILILSASEQCIKKLIQKEADYLNLNSYSFMDDFNNYLKKLSAK